MSVPWYKNPEVKLAINVPLAFIGILSSVLSGWFLSKPMYYGGLFVAGLGIYHSLSDKNTRLDKFMISFTSVVCIVLPIAYFLGNIINMSL